jgi:hypothetical protein
MQLPCVELAMNCTLPSSKPFVLVPFMPPIKLAGVVFIQQGVLHGTVCSSQQFAFVAFAPHQTCHDIFLTSKEQQYKTLGLHDTICSSKPFVFVALSPCRTGRDNLHSTKCFG